MNTQETKSQFQGQIRALLAAAGGVLVTLGVTDTETAEATASTIMSSYEVWGGVVLMVVTAVWSWVSKKGWVRTS